jgi:hypothetical protein
MDSLQERKLMIWERRGVLVKWNMKSEGLSTVFQIIHLIFFMSTVAHDLFTLMIQITQLLIYSPIEPIQ